MADRPSPATKAARPYLLVSDQFAKRDPVVSYYAMLYAIQEGIPASKNDPDAKALLVKWMDKLETMKARLGNEEAIKNEIVAQAHVEFVALKLFDFADEADRNTRFDRNMIKAFLTSSHLFTILKQFGELSAEVSAKLKYAKWKAVEIDKCLKNGITPTPGPPAGEELQEGLPVPRGEENPVVVQPYPPPPTSEKQPWEQPYPPGPVAYQKPTPKPRHQPATPLPSSSTRMAGNPVVCTASDQRPSLPPEVISKTQKLCKFASSALEYEDTAGAVDYLTQALELLKSAGSSP